MANGFNRKRKAGPKSQQARRKRTGFRRRRTANITNKMCRQLGLIVTPKQKVTLRYGFVWEIDPAAGISAEHLFKANGLFDPENNVLGHQPRGFDEWSSFYKHYRVTSSSCSANFQTTANTSSAANAIVGIRLHSANDTYKALPSFVELVEGQVRNTRYRFLTARDSSRGQVKVGKTFGRRDWENGTSPWSTTFPITGDPIGHNLYQYQVFIAPLDTTVPDLANMYVQVVLTYQVEFSNPVHLNAS